MRLWRLSRPQPGMVVGMGGGAVIPVVGPLPDAGGLLDQAAWMLDAFDFLDATEAKRLKGG